METKIVSTRVDADGKIRIELPSALPPGTEIDLTVSVRPNERPAIEELVRKAQSVLPGQLPVEFSAEDYRKLMVQAVEGRVEAEGVVIDSSGPLPIGTRFEGYTVHPERLNRRSPTDPLTVEEAKRLLGDEIVAACERRGLSPDRLKWNHTVEHRDGYRDGELDSLIWYGITPSIDPEQPCETWLPLFAHLVRSVQSGSQVVFWHLRAMGVTIPSTFERGTQLDQILLTMLLIHRVIDAVLSNSNIGIHTTYEAITDGLQILADCAQAIERLRADSVADEASADR